MFRVDGDPLTAQPHQRRLGGGEQIDLLVGERLVADGQARKGAGSQVLCVKRRKPPLDLRLRFLLQLLGQSLTTPSHAALIMMLEPVWTALAAAWWFGETMSALQLVGCGLIFMALVVSR